MVDAGVLVEFTMFGAAVFFRHDSGFEREFNILQSAWPLRSAFSSCWTSRYHESRPDAALVSPRGEIEFRHVCSATATWKKRQPAEEDWVLGRILLHAIGQTFAIVGHTGAGKTTLISLLLRFYDIQRGQILLDGVDIRLLDLQELRKQFGIVLQDPFLFSGTIESKHSTGHAGNFADGCRESAGRDRAGRIYPFTAAGRGNGSE